MNTFFQMILVVASLTLCAGCPSDPIGSNTKDASTQNNFDGSTNIACKDDYDCPERGHGDYVCNEKEHLCSKINWKKSVNLTIHVQTPDGLPVDLYVCSGGCFSASAKPFVDAPDNFLKKLEGVKEMDWTLHQNGVIDLYVYAVRKNYLFTYLTVHYVVGDKTEDTVNVGWTDVGSVCAVPPGGQYLSSLGTKKTVSTNVKNGKCTLTVEDIHAIVTNHELSPDPASQNFQVTGKLSDDLHSIQVQVTVPSSPQDNFQETLTFVQ